MIMGRRVPNDNISSIEPFVYFSFSFVGFFASISIITVLCGFGFKRKKTPPPPPPIASPNNTYETKVFNVSDLPSTMEAATISPEPPQLLEKGKPADVVVEVDNNNDLLSKELPLPPAMLASKDTNMSCSMRRDTSVRRTSFSLSSLSMKMPRSFSVAKHHQKEENDVGKKEKLKQDDDSVWMKTIILGEKCNPDEEDEEAITYEGKGKRISFSAYHPRQSTLSRQCSFLDHDSLAVSQAQNLEERIRQ